MSLYHVFTQYVPKDPDTIRRNTLAQTSWPRQFWRPCPVRDEDVPRLWQEEGRSFPYLRDLFDFSVQGKLDTDIIIHTNADIHVRSDCSLRICFALQETDACYCFRRDFARLDSVPPDDVFVTGHDYPGHDLTAFRVGWWRQHRSEMPDMVVGFEAYDPCIRILIDKTNPGKDVTLHDLIAHERHSSYWEKSENRYRLNGQKYNIALAKGFLSANGIDPRTRGLR
jgi:hypothetical protein